MNVFGKRLAVEPMPPHSELVETNSGKPAGLSTASLVEEREEEVWVERICQGDLEAFDHFITRYRERALRLAALVLHDSDSAEDVVQEAFCAFMVRLVSTEATVDSIHGSIELLCGAV